METSGSRLTASRICDDVQLRLIRGSGALPDELLEHLENCSECGFLRTLSRNLPAAVGSVAGAADAGPLGAPIHAALAAAMDSGELLLARYLLKSRIGRGGYGEVYRTVDTETDEVVALKIVRVRADDDRTTEEVRNARRVVHRNVCRVFHTERFGELRLIVMEYIEGTSLDQRPPGRLPRKRALGLFRAIADGVHAAHDAGVLHLDLKPRNVLLRDGQVPVVTDFGLSVRLVGGEGVAFASGGTPAYMASEQRAGGIVDRRTDVYALGLILRDLLGGRLGLLRRVFRRATAAEPERRYRDVAQLIRAVDLHRRLVRWTVTAAVIVAGLAAGLVLLGLIVPPPRGPRATWRAELWGDDPVPASAWNVARNPGGTGRPRVRGARGWGCAQKATDLVDGTAEYTSWEHGLSFPPLDDLCFSLRGLAPWGGCGSPRPEARVCQLASASPDGVHHVLDQRIADLSLTSAEAPAGLGELVEGLPCGERTVTVELDRPARVFAVRTWYHRQAHRPHAYMVAVADPSGGRRVVFSTPNVLGKHRDLGQEVASATPLTAQFPPATTDEIDVIIDTCGMKDDIGNIGHGWLYEIEVFATLSRFDAWSRYFRGD